MYLCAVNNILAEIMPRQKRLQSATGIYHVILGMKNDSNGALTYDSNRGINSITYDYSHYPSTIARLTQLKTVYNDYTPDGKKLFSRHLSYIPNGNGSNTRVNIQDLYIDDLMLRGGTPLMWRFSGGYGELNANGAPTSWNYYVTDHLGSTRMVVDSNDSIKEVINYYPFGSEMRMTNPALLTGGTSHPYRFTGKELDKVNNLNMYDFGARWYDVAGVPMWTSIDPLAEEYYNVSPYAYCANNPVKYIDIGGEWFWNSMGNLVVDKNDNYITLAEFLGTTESNAAFILGSVGLFPDAPEVYSVIPKESIYVIESQKDGTVVNNTKEAVLHYFEGNGEAADVGNESIFELLKTDEFTKNYNAIVTEGRESNEFAVDMTHKIFHIGRTGVSYIVHNGKVGKDSSSKVTP